jgi:hypothetical protein
VHAEADWQRITSQSGSGTLFGIVG